VTVLQLVEAEPDPAPDAPHPADLHCGYCDRTLPPWTVTDLGWWKPRRQGRPLYEIGPERLPSRPVGMYLEQRARRLRAEWQTPEEQFGEVCALAGIKFPRSVWAWRRGERATVDFDVVDRILVNLGLNWWDIYTPEQVRRAVIVARVHRVRPKKGSHGSDKICMTREIAGEVHYGDAGPDLALLDVVREAFEGDARDDPSTPVRVCGNGHPLTSENLRPRSDGRWSCRRCDSNRNRKRHHRRRQLEEGKAA
jgi:hypothetical protein